MTLFSHGASRVDYVKTKSKQLLTRTFLATPLLLMEWTWVVIIHGKPDRMIGLALLVNNWYPPPKLYTTFEFESFSMSCYCCLPTRSKICLGPWHCVSWKWHQKMQSGSLLRGDTAPNKVLYEGSTWKVTPTAWKTYTLWAKRKKWRSTPFHGSGGKLERIDQCSQ